MLVLYAVLVLITLFLTGVAGATLWWMMHAWSTPTAFEGAGYAGVVDGGEQLSFSLIMPCREEHETVMRATLERLLNQDYPDFEVVISVGHDDVATVEIARRLAGTDPRIKVSVNTDRVKNKPRQLNSALAMCTKDVVGIIDAESLTQPGLLAHINATFAVKNADVVQGSVHLMNVRSSWYALRNCLEYRIWFRSRLHGHALSGFIPLGGNTVFTKRALLNEVGGWDGDCLAEDCEIGVRLSALGKTIVCAYDSALTTQEEAPTSLKAFVKQRTRWALGFMQVLSKGEWKKLPTRRDRFNAWWTLSQQHAVAFSGACLPVAIASALFLDTPDALVLLSFLPLVPMVLTLAFEALVLREFGAHMGFRVRLRDYVVLIVSFPFYSTLLSIATCRALWKYARRDFLWEKTEHSGAHHGFAGAPLTQVEAA